MKTNVLSIMPACRPAVLSVLAAFALLLFSACQPNRQENKAEEVIINGLSDTEWSYFLTLSLSRLFSKERPLA